MDSSREREAEQAAPVSAPEAVASAAQPTAAAGPMTPARIAALQRTAGNAAVSRLLAGGDPRPPVRSSAAAVVGRASILDDIKAADENGKAAGDEKAGGDREAPDGEAPAPEAEPAPGPEAEAEPAPGPEAEAEPAPGPEAEAEPASGPEAAKAEAPAREAKAEPAAAGPAPAAEEEEGKGTKTPEARTSSPGADSPGGGEAKASGPPAVKLNKDPHADPAFRAMKGRSKGAAGSAKAHEPAPVGAASAQAAAEPPSNDTQSQAQAAQVDEMSKKEPGEFDREGFIAAVKEAIEKSAPKNLEEADDYKADGVKEQVQGKVKEGKEGSEKEIKEATVATPDTSKAKPKKVTPMKDEPVGNAPGSVGAKEAMPKPVPAEATDLSAGPESVEAKMREAQVTDEQIKKSNEPEFQGALEARDQAKEHSKKAPQDFRKDEQGVLSKAAADAQGLEGTGLTTMHGARGKALGQAKGHKQGAKTADEAKRAKVASDLQGIYEKTKGDVTKLLDGLDGKVDKAFSEGEGRARRNFESYVNKRMDAYKEQRYSGVLGKGRWVKDKLMGLPEEVNRFYADGKTRYLREMDGVIGRIADIVGKTLTAARARIAKGKAEVAKYVKALPQDLKKVGQEAQEKLQGQFEQLEADVEAKQSEMVDTLARKYVEARDALDERIEELKAANRGLVDKAMDAIAGVVKTILQLKNMLLGVLAKAAGVIGDIIADPIGFLSNLISGIKAGLNRFVGNIAGHLQAGLMGWLTGTLGKAGLEMPKSLDAKGIFGLVVQILGVTYQNIRARVVKQVGEPAMSRMEKTVDFFKVLISEGIPGLFGFVKDKIGDLENTVLGEIKTFIIERVIKAGITWLIAFMNPAAAFIKACKMIYDIVMFIIERGAEIMSFVNSVLDSIAAVVKGNIGAMAERIEQSLAKALPLAISFLASLLGLGGVADKVRSVIDKVRAPVTRAIDKVITGVVKRARKLFAKPKKWIKDKLRKGKQWAKDKYEKGKNWAKDKARSVKDRFTGKDKDKGDDAASSSDEGKDVKRQAGIELRKRAAGPLASVDALREIVAGILSDLRPKGLKDMRAVASKGEPGTYDVYATASPTDKVGEASVPAEEDPELALLDDGATSLDERRSALEGARALAGAGPIAYVLDSVRGKRLKPGRALDVLRRIVKHNLKGGYELRTQEREDRVYGRVLDITYFGLHHFQNNFPKVGAVTRAPNNPTPVGMGYVKVVNADSSGDNPVKVLGLDFLVPESVEQAGIRGVGSEMMRIAAAHFQSQYEAVVGEWYTASWYATKSGSRPAMSKNLESYLAERRKGASPEDAAKKTWTYRRVQELYGGVELDVKVQEFVDIEKKLPPDEQIVQVVMKPKA